MPETSLEGAVSMITRVREKLMAAKLSWHGFFLSITLTFGIAWHATENSLDETLKQADIALYQGKTEGRDCIVTFNNGLEPNQ